MQGIKGNLKIVPSYEDDFDKCLDSLGKILIERITTAHKNSEIDLAKYDDISFTPVLDKVLQINDAFLFEEKLVLLLGIAPYIRPGFLEDIMAQALPQGGEFIAFGGVKGQHHRGILPTGETALFLLAGMNISKRLHFQKIFGSDALFAKYGLLQVDSVSNKEPNMSGRLTPDADWLELILLGQEAAPVHSIEFPARKISTSMLWEDLVLHPQTKDQINDIQVWMNHHDKIFKDPTFGRKIKPGYRVLFYGKPGTGKTLTASLLGNKFDIPVYRIDLSLVISKYIGETEKHIELVFSRAERKRWILFFDEADALFHKRVGVNTSNDRAANQEVSYLLQRIEDFEGLLILASNFKNNIDDAFLRRFHNIIHFPMPGTSERYKLWVQSIPGDMKCNSDIDWKEIADKYEITGAEIINVMYYASLKAYSRKENIILKNDVYEGIKKELKKQDKAFSY
ncbi:ATP-binding protein [Aquimarina megaterium]|uniref:ATP-binding protein n=1 Tax=Aquimarina megaterium TaxID=1443666 RepID=UPI00046F5127|nr:ATP-binding protein [Aquimarina megaterium]